MRATRLATGAFALFASICMARTAHGQTPDQLQLQGTTGKSTQPDAPPQPGYPPQPQPGHPPQPQPGHPSQAQPGYPPQPAQPGYPQPAYPPQPGYGYPPGYEYPPAFQSAQIPPVKIAYVEGQPAPPGYHLSSKSQRGLVIGGAITFGIAYGLTLLSTPIVAAVREDNGENPDNASVLMIPALGPFLSIWALDSHGVGTSFLILDGITQTAGAAMLIGGLTSRTKIWLRNDVAGVTYQITPGMVAPRTPGLGVRGAF